MPGNSKDQYSAANADDEFANGPVQKRSCTDILCLILFVAFIGGMFGITGYAIDHGHPELVGRGYDADGMICGYSPGYENYPFVYWPAPISSLISHTVCVSSCPNDNQNTVDCHPNQQIPNCIRNTPIYDANLINENTFLIYNTTSRKTFLENKGLSIILIVAGRVCLPLNKQILSQVSQQFINSDLLGQWMSDVRTTWPMIAGSLGIALVIGFLYMIFLRYCAGLLTWAAIVFFIAGTAILGWRFWEKAVESKQLKESTEEADQNVNVKDTEVTEKVLAAICWGISGLTLLSVFCLYGQIRLAIGILKAAADYVKDTLSVLIVPPIFFVILILFYTYWAIAAVFMVSSGEIERNQTLNIVSFNLDTKMERLLIYHLFALLWGNAFINAASQFIIASSVCIWYFAQNTGKGSSGSIRKSVYRLFRYHLGSIAFGSLVLAIVQFIRVVLAYVEQKTKQWAGSETTIVKYTLRCLQCYVYCFERFIKFLNKNAWIQIALSGKNFCAAARAGLSLAVNNPLRYGVVYGIGNIFVLFGKCFIAAVSTLIGFVVITKADRFASHIYSPFIPTMIMLVLTYTVGALFLNVYGMAADTILACFVVDEQAQKQRNAVSHCPSSLKEFLDKHRQN